MTDAETTCARVVDEIHAFYAERHVAFHDRGYHVMYGPPVTRPPILFIGYQPGGDQRTDDHLRARPVESWPDRCLYAGEPWRLAAIMRDMFGVEFLERCTGLNAIFIRSPDIKTYRAEVAPSVRREVADFCLTRVQAVVEALDPVLVVAIGFASLELFGATEPELVSAKGRTLVTRGTVGEREALATIHLSGGYIATADRAAIAERVLARVHAGIPS